MLPLIYLLGLLLLAVLALRSMRQNEHTGIPRIAPGKEAGVLDTYLARIETLASQGVGGFFVTATEQDSERFVQVSAGRDASGVLRYQFSIPVTEWSRAYAVRIEAEARHRGLDTGRKKSGPMTFLDVDLDDTGQHAVFVRWVVGDVYGLDGAAQFDITWG